MITGCASEGKDRNDVSGHAPTRVIRNGRRVFLFVRDNPQGLEYAADRLSVPDLHRVDHRCRFPDADVDDIGEQAADGQGNKKGEVDAELGSRAQQECLGIGDQGAEIGQGSQTKENYALLYQK